LSSALACTRSASAPERPSGRPAGRWLEALAQFDLAIVSADGDREVVELDRMLLLQLDQGLRDLAGGCLVGDLCSPSR
jgi:hypothetical protein